MLVTIVIALITMIVLSLLLVQTGQYTMIAFYESVQHAALDYITGLADQSVRIDGNDIVVPELNQVLGVFGLSTNLDLIQLLAPSLRREWNEFIYPYVQGLIPEGVNGGFAMYHDNPFLLDVTEKLNIQIANTGAGAPEDVVVIVLLGDGVITPETGLIRTIRAVPDTAPTAYEWSNTEITFDETLPAGRYAICGATWVDASGIVARFVPIGGVWRPGFIAQAIGDPTIYSPFRHGRFGRMTEFEFDQPPSVDLLSSGTSKGELFLDLKMIRKGRI